MKKVKKMMASVLVNVAKNNVKNDINSTGSDWIYQPKMPQGCEKFKKASK
ncbi:MAG: cyclic lactone autoinducer peptide [Oscillospiraceae bacterium]|nr:cyclic lactone autoinducer peptide [Oscillospiraceae bacterium]MDD7292629.1 cyclic lactone autoinducer peptide [Clostridiaceae bacterium]MDY5992202.1 cyclic lactone autoinducer peptide [Oscillospiraceae bacterium]